MWLPEAANERPVPAVIEYAPFRYRDFTYPRDALIHPWFAGHGYASIRLEPAGAMDSDGAPMDEYVLREQTDCVEALEWIAAQPWCSGHTGMFGMSWGAISALQVAAHRPPSLKAIIPVHGTDERFGEDVHYKGGCMLTANLAWGALYQTYMMRPPYRASAGDDWRHIWKQRLETAPNILKTWMEHQSRDDYWRHASICENHADITAATYVICGWADGYTNAALRMVDGLKCPHKVLIGPWAHTYPHIALPGPQIGFLQEATHWWDRWLKETPNGADQDAILTYYMQGSVPPAPSYGHREGRWISENHWPSEHVEMQSLYLNRNQLSATPEPGMDLAIKTPLNNAMTGWEWLPHGVGPEMPLDQNAEDAGSLCFDTEPLETTVEICGAPVVNIICKADTKKGAISVRLSDIAPDGAATLISYGLLNLVHRDGFEKVKDISSGEEMRISVPLDQIAQIVPVGHRLRLSISTQSWPLTWPSAEAMTLQVTPGSSVLELPLRPLDAPDGKAPLLPPAEAPPPAELNWQRPMLRERTITHDLKTGRQTRRYLKDDGAFVIKENGQLVDSCGELIYSSIEGDPLSAEALLNYDIKMSDADTPVTLATRIKIVADHEHFMVDGTLSATDDGASFHEEALAFKIPRRSV